MFHHYTECGLNNIQLLNGFRWIDGPRGRALQIDDLEGLHKQIGLTLVHERKALNGKEMRFLRHELELTQQALGTILGVDAQTIARWEKGETERVTPAADRLLRLLFLEKVDGNPAISEALTRIAALDEAPSPAGRPLAFWVDPEDGWRYQEPKQADAA